MLGKRNSSLPSSYTQSTENQDSSRTRTERLLIRIGSVLDISGSVVPAKAIFAPELPGCASLPAHVHELSIRREGDASRLTVVGNLFHDLVCACTIIGPDSVGSATIGTVIHGTAETTNVVRLL
jgi:hypothetical protein